MPRSSSTRRSIGHGGRVVAHALLGLVFGGFGLLVTPVGAQVTFTLEKQLDMAASGERTALSSGYMFTGRPFFIGVPVRRNTASACSARSRNAAPRCDFLPLWA